MVTSLSCTPNQQSRLGTTLSHVDSVDSPSDLYDECMSLIVRLGKYGLIHGDFNEFNLMLTQDGKLVMIDFPQMISIDHENAEYYFNRDVECIREFFRRKFHYESEAFPKISDVERKHNLDVELAASGFTKEMAKDLNKVRARRVTTLLSSVAIRKTTKS